jgi:hypothetical protein
MKLMKRWLRKLQHKLKRRWDKQNLVWEYKVVQMVAQAPADPDDASRKLGGSLSAEALRNQFPEYYSQGNGRAQISSFLNDIGRDGWELIQIQQIADLPLMIFKRPLRSQSVTSMAKPMEQAAAEPHAGHPD